MVWRMFNKKLIFGIISLFLFIPILNGKSTLNSNYNYQNFILRRVRGGLIFPEQRAYYIKILSYCSIPLTEENIQLLHNLNNAAHKAGFEPDYLFGYSLPALAKAGILTGANLSQIVELGKASYEAGFKPYYLFEYSLPALAEAGILTIDNLSEVGNKLVELGKASYEAGFEPYYLFEYSLPALARAGILTVANLSQIVELGKEVYSYQADYKLFVDKIPALLEKGFNLSDILPGGNFYQKIMLFVKSSGRYFTNNVSFLDTLTPENIEEEIDSVLEYFEKLGRPLYLPKLYSTYRSLDEASGEELLREFNDYYYKQLNGIKAEDSRLPEEIKEEVNFYIIGSTNLTLEEYRDTLSRFGGQEIPEPNFRADFEMNLNLSEIMSNLDEDDINYFSEKIDWLKEIINVPLSNYIAEVLARFYTHFLIQKQIPSSCPELAEFVNIVARDNIVTEAIANKDTEGIKNRIIEIIEEGDFQEAGIVSEIFEAFSSNEDGVIPSVGMLRSLIRLKIAQMYATDRLMKGKIDNLINSKQAIQEGRLRGQELYGLVSDLIEVLTEIKPQAVGELRKRIDQAVEMDKITQLLKGFSTPEGKDVEEVRVLASKTDLDYFYGYFGENCTSSNPEELLNPHFTPLRIITSKGIEGAIYTLTYTIDGKKSLLIVGIEPQSGLVSRIDPQEFTQKLLEKIIEEVAIKGGYEQVLIATNPAAQSNRQQIREEIQRLIRDKEIITQNAQPTFPAHTNYDITRMAVYWQR
jgi:hypothetical protein